MPKTPSILRELRAFISRGNVVDLAVAVVIGAAFTTVVNAFVRDLLTPIIAAIAGKSDVAVLTFSIRGSTFFYGDFVNAVVAFLLVAAALFFFVIKPLNYLAARRQTEAPDPKSPTRPCPECLSEIPVAATRCAFCTTQLGAA